MEIYRKLSTTSEKNYSGHGIMAETFDDIGKKRQWQWKYVGNFRQRRKITISVRETRRIFTILQEWFAIESGKLSENANVIGKKLYRWWIYPSPSSESNSVTQIVWSSYIRYIDRNFSSAFLSVKHESVKCINRFMAPCIHGPPIQGPHSRPRVVM